MSPWLRRLLLSVGVIAVFALSLTLVHALGPGGTNAVRELSRSLVPLAAGVVIGAVGVFLGSLGSLYALIAANEKDDNVELDETVAGIRATASEIRQDVVLILMAAIAVEAAHAFRTLDVKWLQWPFTHPWLGRELVVDATILTITLLAFVALIDVVLAMFSVHAQYDLLHDKNRKGAKN